MKSSPLIFAVSLVAFGQTSGSGVPVPNPPAVPQFTQLVAGSVYDQLYGFRPFVAGLLPVSKGFWFSLTAIIATNHLNDTSTGLRVIAPSSELWVEGYKALYTGKALSVWIGSGLRVNVSASGAVSSLGSTGLNPPISTVVRYAISGRWSVVVGTRTTFIAPPTGSSAKGWWDFAPAAGFGYNIP